VAELIGVEHDLTHSQWIDRLRPAAIRCGEQKLQCAVLERALTDYKDYSEYRDEVREWVEARDQLGPFSFEAICASLSWDLAAAREALRRWMDRVDLRAWAKRVGLGTQRAPDSCSSPSASAAIRDARPRGLFQPDSASSCDLGRQGATWAACGATCWPFGGAARPTCVVLACASVRANLDGVGDARRN